MHALEVLRSRDDRPTEDHVVFFDGVSWEDYERLLEMRGDRSAPRITYLEGTVEIMSPSRDHEGIKSYVGRLVEVYCLEHGIRFTPLGSWTLKERPKERGVEPDECYVFGTEPSDRPHLAIEIIWTSGRIDKLDVYRKLGVRELWLWRKGVLSPYVLRGERYVSVKKSKALPGIDLALLCEHLDRPTAFDAIQDFRAAIRPAIRPKR